jgi:hypothetical protein
LKGRELTKHNDALFEESSQGAVSAITAIVFVSALVLFFGGLVLSSYAFGAGDSALALFAAGLGASTLGFMLPFWILPTTGK